MSEAEGMAAIAAVVTGMSLTAGMVMASRLLGRHLFSNLPELGEGF
jgi:hypothetical protein